MAAIKVYHDPETNFREARTKEEAFAAIGRSFAVALLRDTEDLEWAYWATNNIDHPWTENPQVQQPCGVAAPGQHRSTSVGDFLLLYKDNIEVLYQVANIGFTEIERTPF